MAIKGDGSCAGPIKSITSYAGVRSTRVMESACACATAGKQAAPTIKNPRTRAVEINPLFSIELVHLLRSHHMRPIETNHYENYRGAHHSSSAAQAQGWLNAIRAVGRGAARRALG